MHDPLIFCANQIDVIMNFAVITNVVIKRVHCIKVILVLFVCFLPCYHNDVVIS